VKALRIVTIPFLLAFGSSGCAAGSCPSAKKPVHIDTRDDVMSVLSDNSPLLRYSFTDKASKPYILELFTPAGYNVLRDAPADHIHHHGLMFAVSVDGTSFWTERSDSGRQLHRRFDDVGLKNNGDTICPGFTEHLDWLGPDGKKLLNEIRTIRLCRITDGPATLLTWQTRLELPKGASYADLDGAHYYGLGMRFLEWMDAVGCFRNAAGKPGEIFRGDERLAGSKWCAYSAELDEGPVTVAMFDHPENPRPVTWFTMSKPFAYLAATMALHSEPLRITAEKPLTLRYAVALWDRHIDSEKIDALCNDWLRRPLQEAGPGQTQKPKQKMQK